MKRHRGTDKDSANPTTVVRTKNSLFYGEEVRLHTTSKKYNWTFEDTKKFHRYLEKNPNAEQDLEPLLVELDLHGYEDIKTDEGLNFKWEIAMPKVRRKIKEIKKKNQDNQEVSDDQDPDYTPGSDEHDGSESETIPEPRHGNLESGHDKPQRGRYMKYQLNTVPEHIRSIEEEVAKLHSASHRLIIIYRNLPTDSPLVTLLRDHRQIVRDIGDRIEETISGMAPAEPGYKR
ncbi:hypothetical protein F4776DRAFT_294082 [Hypoxylon sp. NC0597]|nr:hypothetical protein F4776DRAFT_294082 [Hypoxylon sp. NC0597]